MKTRPRPSTKAAFYAEAARFGPSASFVANVIAVSHANPHRKLRGLVALLRRGCDVRCGQFAIDVLVVDGRQIKWADLETTR